MSSLPTRINVNEKPRLTAEDWEHAALDLIAEKGISGLGIEPLARRLGITKGSFYWHFSSREQLLEQALVRWEAHDIENLARALGDGRPAEQRLSEFVIKTSRQNRSHEIHAALCAASDHPSIKPVIERVTQRRLDYIAGALSELGLDADAARHRARLVYTSYVGYIQLQARGMAPERLSPEFEAYIQHVIHSLITTA
ncbi:MAG: TetR/AcrR family transcriptional regulator [Pseudomonadota bacterium]